MSVGANVLFRLAEQAAAALGERYDVEIVEAHHRHKRDAPSGTAKTLLECICRARDQDPATAGQLGRAGKGLDRPAGQVGMHSIRLGELIGQHEVHFADACESLTIRHEARDRDVFVAGALQAAAWIIGQPAGLYTMRDLLGNA
jgi:4-hydroxy-tetrahydrodipicolinate reductase